jgi:hypothetical protein
MSVQLGLPGTTVGGTLAAEAGAEVINMAAIIEPNTAGMAATLKNLFMISPLDCFSLFLIQSLCS